MSRAALNDKRNGMSMGNGASRTSSQTPIAVAALSGTKRTVDGSPIERAPENNDTLVKKLLSDMAIYTRNVIQSETENMKRHPERAYHSSLAFYNAKKMAATREMLEVVLASAPTVSSAPNQPATPDTTPSRVTSTESEVKKLVQAGIQAMRYDLLDEIREQACEDLEGYACDMVDDYWSEKGRDLVKDVLDDLDADEELELVKETVLNQLKRAKEVGDALDTQDQLRVYGDLLN